MRVPKLIIFLIAIYTGLAFGQTENTRMGSIYKQVPTTGGFYDYSDPGTVNMNVSVWGYVRMPGKYMIPLNVTVADLISYAGGPSSDATLEDIRLVRVKADSTQEVITLNYNELLYEPKITKNIKNPVLQPGDILVLTGEPRFYFRDYFSMTLSIVSTLISLAILIITIARK
ncbi:MAG: SLBB domain-containing protein [Ignavibacteriales bacterium]|nr:SLBB domain-containing protein [Ignavibacteriales bacterium]